MRASCGCSWETGAHMTEFSADGVGAHKAGALRVTCSGSSTEGAYVFGTLGVDMFGRLALKAPYHGGSGGFRVGDGDGVVVGSGLHNHLQSSREHNTSSAYSRSTSSVSPSPATLSQCRVVMILFPCGKEGSSRVAWEGVCSSGQLGRRVDSSISRGKGFSRGGDSGRARGAGISSRVRGRTAILLASLHCSLH